MARWPESWQLDFQPKLKWDYCHGLELQAMLDVYDRYGDDKIYEYALAYADTMVNADGTIKMYKREEFSLDRVNSGKFLFRIYEQTKDEKYKKALALMRSQFEDHPRNEDGGFWHKLVYQHQMWLDGIYMASPFMAEYGATFNQPQWIDEAVRQIRVCHKHTFDARTGLYYHAWDESKNQRWANSVTGQSPNFWGRSIGWWFMALVDVLDFVPADHEGRADLIAYVQGLAASLPYYQDKDGLWYQVIDQPEREGNFPEASVTTQCMYAIAKAVNKGYIDPKYRAVAEKAFNGLKEKLLRENPDGTLTLSPEAQASYDAARKAVAALAERRPSETDAFLAAAGYGGGYDPLDPTGASGELMPSPEDTGFFSVTEEDLVAADKHDRKVKRKHRHTGLKVFIFILVLLLLVAGAGVFGYVKGYGWPTQESVAESLFEAKSSGQELDPYVASGTSESVIEEMSDVMPTGDTTVTVLGVDRSMTESTVYLTATLAEGGEQDYTVELVRDGISWKVTTVTPEYASQGASGDNSEN